MKIAHNICVKKSFTCDIKYFLPSNYCYLHSRHNFGTAFTWISIGIIRIVIREAGWLVHTTSYVNA